MNGLISVTFMFLNLGLLCGLCLGVVLLLQPLTKRVLSPRQQVNLWVVGWAMAYMPSVQMVLGYIQLLPWTLRDFLVHRTSFPEIMWGRGNITSFSPQANTPK